MRPLSARIAAALSLLAGAASAQNAQTLIAVGVDQGPPAVKTFDTALEPTSFFLAFEPNVQGARVAVGDVNADGVLDVVAGAGHGGRGQVKVVDGRRLNDIDHHLVIEDAALLGNLQPFGRRFRGDVNVASGDVNNDGYDDVIVGSGPGAKPTVRVYDGARLSVRDHSGRGALLASFDAFDPHFRGGVSVAAGDQNGDGFADVIVGARSNSIAYVNVFDGSQLGGGEGHPRSLSRLLSRPKIIAILIGIVAYPETFTGGVLVGSGIVSPRDPASIITAPSTPGDGTVQVFSEDIAPAAAGKAQTVHIFRRVFGDDFVGGVRVAAADVNGDGLDEIFCAANAGSGPEDTVMIATYSDTAEGGLAIWGSFEPFQNKGIKVEPVEFTGTGFFVGARTIRSAN